METNSYFVEIKENSKGKFIRRRKRKGIKPYARTLSLNKINKILSNSKVLYPKLLRNYLNFVDEEYIELTDDIKDLSKKELIDYFANTIINLNQIDIKKYKKYIRWNNNSEFMSFQIDNLKKALKKKRIIIKNDFENQLNDIDSNVDNSRKLTFIHGDLHTNNLVLNADNIYIIDWEMATIGDLAYELAIHFILMDYSEKEQNNFIEKILNKIECDKGSLIHDINEYKKFELIRRKILHGNIENHYH